MSAWLAMTYLLAAVDPCAPLGIVNCASPVSARARDFVCVCVMLGYATGRAAVWLCIRSPCEPTETCLYWQTPATVSTRMLAIQNTRTKRWRAD